jgi:hypothetical protein
MFVGHALHSDADRRVGYVTNAATDEIPSSGERFGSEGRKRRRVGEGKEKRGE